MIQVKNRRFTYNEFLTAFFARSHEEEKQDEDPFKFGAIISNKALLSIKKTINNSKHLIQNRRNSQKKESNRS